MIKVTTATSDGKQTNKKQTLSSTNQNEGAWLQLNDYKIQKNDYRCDLRLPVGVNGGEMVDAVGGATGSGGRGTKQA